MAELTNLKLPTVSKHFFGVFPSSNNWRERDTFLKHILAAKCPPLRPFSLPKIKTFLKTVHVLFFPKIKRDTNKTSLYMPSIRTIKIN